MTFRYRQFEFTHYKNISSVRKIIPLSIKLGLFGHGFAIQWRRDWRKR